MEFLELAKKRKSIRKYKNAAVEKEKLDKIIEAARLAPSAVNRQKWMFYIIQSPEMKAKLAETTGTKWHGEAGAVIAACGTDCGIMTNGHRSDTTDLSIAMTFAMLEACELGLGSCWLASYNEEKVKKLLGLSESYSVVSLLAVGYPDEDPEPRARKSAEEISRFV